MSALRQMGLEYIGKRTDLANAEVVATAIEAMIATGVPEFRARIGHVKLLGSILRRYGIDPSSDKDAMIAIDKKDRDAIERALEGRTRKEIDPLVDLLTTIYLPDEAENELSRIGKENPDLQQYCMELMNLLSLLSGLKAHILFDPSISRGLDYYDGMVFEMDIPSLGAEKQVCGGGAYSLTSVFGSEVDGIGFAIGFDRVMVALKDTSAPMAGGSIYIIPLGEVANVAAFDLQRELIAKGHVCILETQGRNLKKALASASASGSSHAIILGSEEVEKGEATVKDLRTGEQTRIHAGSVHAHIQVS
jgi:histidyl-tRNA synthetase